MIRKSGMKYFLYLLNTSSCASVMKTKISIIISAILVLSCGNNWQSDETDNIVLSEFSKELISLYLQDSIVLSRIIVNNTVIIALVAMWGIISIWAELFGKEKLSDFLEKRTSVFS